MAKVLADAIMVGLFSALPTDNDSDPATGTIGRLYYATDQHRWYQDNGTAWVQRQIAFVDLIGYFGLAETDGDILTWAGSGYGNYRRDQVPVSDWGAAEADLDLGTHKITNLAAPVGANDAARKADLPTVPDNLTDLDPADGDVAMGGHKITGLGAPASGGDATNKTYVDGGLTTVASAIPDNLTDLDPADGDVAMGGHKLTGLATPTASGDATTKGYVDTAIAGVSASGNLTDLDPADGDVDMGGFEVVNMAPPTADLHAATKKYVDDVVAGVTASEAGVLVAPGDLVVGAGSGDVIDRTGGSTAGWTAPTGISGGTFPNDVTDNADGTNVQFTNDAGGVQIIYDAGAPIHVNRASLSQDGPGDPSGRASWELLSSEDGISWDVRLTVASALVSHTYDLDDPATAQYWQFHDTADTGTDWNIRHLGMSDAATAGTPVRKAIPSGAANKFLKVNATEDGYVFDVPPTPDGGGSPALKDSFGLLKAATKSSKVENIVINSGDSADLLTVTGGGTITAFTLITGGDTFDDEVAYDTILNIYVDGEGTPSISFDLGVFGTRFNPDKTVRSTLNIGVEAVTAAASALPAGVASGQLTFRFPIFFAESVRFEFVNDTASNTLAFLNAFYAPGVTQNRRLKSASVTWADKVTRTPGGGDYEFLNVASGPGAIVWHSLAAQGATSPAFLESNVVVYIDGEGTASIQTSGTEDWFGDSFYWAAGPGGNPWSYLGNADIVTDFTVATALDLLAFCGGLQFTDGVRLVWELGGGFSDVDFSYLVLYYTGVDESIGGGGGGSPVSATVMATEFRRVVGTGGDVSIAPRSGQIFGLEVNPDGVADADAWEAGFMLAAGDYKMTALGVKANNRGKITWAIDGTPVATAQDWYAASDVDNAMQTVYFTLTEGGPHLLRLTVAGKNGASSDYVFSLSAVWFALGTAPVDSGSTVMFGGSAVTYGGTDVTYG